MTEKSGIDSRRVKQLPVWVAVRINSFTISVIFDSIKSITIQLPDLLPYYYFNKSNHRQIGMLQILRKTNKEITINIPNLNLVVQRRAWEAIFRFRSASSFSLTCLLIVKLWCISRNVFNFSSSLAFGSADKIWKIHQS